MYRFASLAIFAVLTACSIQGGNGEDIRVNPPPLLSAQPWHVAQQFAGKDGERVCTISAGDLQVTQRASGGKVQRQVGTSTITNPGDYFKVRIRDHVYETPQAWFSPADSDSIIRDMKTAPVVYTEFRERVVTMVHGEWNIQSNTLKLDDFPARYRECESFVLVKQPRRP